MWAVESNDGNGVVIHRPFAGESLVMEEKKKKGRHPHRKIPTNGQSTAITLELGLPSASKIANQSVVVRRKCRSIPSSVPPSQTA